MLGRVPELPEVETIRRSLEPLVTGRAITAFPNDEESLALQASLLDGEPALQAWRKLTAVTSPENAGCTIALP